MRFPGKPLIIFAERRQSVLNLPATFDLETKLEIKLETKYGLRLQVSDKAIRIENIRVFEEYSHDDDKPLKQSYKNQGVSRGDDKKQLNEGVSRDDKSRKPVTRPGSIFTQLSYRLFPDWCTTYLWYKDWTFDTIDVETDVIESRYPQLAKFYWEWRDIYETSFERQECHCGAKAPTFPQVEELVSWATEGFLIACWLALQDNVTEVQCWPGDDHTTNRYHLVKGRLDEELLRFLTDMEALLSAESPTD